LQIHSRIFIITAIQPIKAESINLITKYTTHPAKGKTKNIFGVILLRAYQPNGTQKKNIPLLLSSNMQQITAAITPNTTLLTISFFEIDAHSAIQDPHNGGLTTFAHSEHNPFPQPLQTHVATFSL